MLPATPVDADRAGRRTVNQLVGTPSPSAVGGDRAEDLLADVLSLAAQIEPDAVELPVRTGGHRMQGFGGDARHVVDRDRAA